MDDIKTEWISLAVARGIRTNVPNGYPTNPWRHKFMLHGLHVITEAFSHDVVHAHWAASPEDVQACREWFAQHASASEQ